MAWLIDNIVLIIPGLIVAVIVGVMFGALFGNADSTTSQAANDSVDTAMGIGVYVGYFIAWLAYNWIITTIGGGIGMRAMGIEIVDERTGHAPDAGKALGRTLVSIFSGFLYLGYLWAAWDDDRQTWHDKAAGTIVVRRIETARNARLTRTLPG